METRKLMGEVAVVTGADSGIGQAIALAFAKEGAHVAITYFQDRDGAERTRRMVLEQDRRALVFQLDQSRPGGTGSLARPGEVAWVFQETQHLLGTISILVNAAWADSSGDLVADMRPEDWDREIKTNLYGPLYCCKEFITRLRGQGIHGNIINITSVHQEIPRAGAAAYCASKGALKNLTACLALELAQKDINVNNIAPGMVLSLSDRQDLDDSEVLMKEVAAIPMKRAADPEEIAKVAVFLASKEARYIHGETITVDGALSLFHS